MSNTPKSDLEDDEIAIDLKTVALHFDKEDAATREIMIRYWKRLKYYWNNFSMIYWSESVGDYRIAGRDSEGSNDQAYYDKPVNVFKAFLETIIAALSVQIPAVNCVPDDAENPLDLSTAKAGNIISKQIYRHNDMILLWLKALYVYCTEGLIACHTYEATSEEYGTYKEKKYKDEEVEGYFCPSCKNELNEEDIIMAKLTAASMEDEFDAEESLEDDYSEEPNELLCPNCALALDPNLQKSKLKIPRFDGFTHHPKSRICMDVKGGLYVKVAIYAKKQKDTPYLIDSYDTHYVNALHAYPGLRDRMPKGGFSSADTDEQYARLNIQYRGTIPEENVTVRNCWLRPQSFEILPEERCKVLKDKYPNGAKIVLVNDVIAEYLAENLDDHWTLTENPLSDYLHHEPLGEVLTNIQDIVNDLISLTLQTIEHGIAQTWVDPALIDLNAQRQLEVLPGALTPTKPVSGNSRIADGFFSTSTASLSPEIFSFYRIVNELGQFVSGALPSVFGGAQTGGGDTASEYAMSQKMALQRLHTPWKMLTVWWKHIMMKAIPQYIKLMKEDERIVEKSSEGGYINVFIRKSETTGKIGDIELEPGEQLPISDEQQKEIIMNLMQLNNQEVFSALIAPENLPSIRKIVRIPEFKLPGEDDRHKQLEEIVELLAAAPIPVEPDEMQMVQAMEMGMLPPEPIEQPSVEIDIIVDNHKVEAEICRGWLVSEAGRLAKRENQPGYMNVLLHYKAHIDELNKIMAQQQMQNAPPAGEGKESKPPGEEQKGPEKVTGESNVIKPVQ